MDGMIGRALGKYQIVEQLGEGGMATVFKAYDPSLERYVAIKIIRSGNQLDPLFLQRFQREARALAKLDHPYILKVLDYGEEDGVPYLVMPYVAHGTLKQYTSSRLSYDRAIGIVLPIAEALSYAHNRKIIHRDIKPANILFGESGEPLLSDFGIAKILDAGEQTQLTSTGFGIGTPAYMAPEQWNGIADERTDIYALGVVLYELITTRCPFQADTPAAILIKQVQDPLPRPKEFAPDLPENVEVLIFKALAKDPSLRFQTMQDFIRAMNAVLQSRTTSFVVPPIIVGAGGVTQITYKPTIVERAPIIRQTEPTQKRKWLPFAIGGGAVLTIGFVVVLVIGFSKLNFFNPKKSTGSVNSLAQEQTRQNAQDDPLLALGGTEIQPEPTKINVFQGLGTPKSVDTIEKMPEDIPIYTPNNGDVTTTLADNNLMFSYSSPDESKMIQDFFLTEMKNRNWELNSTSEMSAQGMVMYGFMKDTRNAVIYVMANQIDRTYIQIMIPGN